MALQAIGKNGTNGTNGSPAARPALRIDVWSDIACPWCYVGKRRLEAALAKFEHAEGVTVTWHAFELDPGAPPTGAKTTPPVPYAERLAKKYGMAVPQAEARIRQLTEVAAADGLTMRFDRVRPGNTFDAHRVVHLGADRGLQDAVKERLLRAYMTEGESIGDHATLARLAVEAGLDAGEAHDVLASDSYADAVRADEAEARELGINGVPFFVLDQRYAVSGAQPAELLLGALRQAWADVEARAIAARNETTGGAADEAVLADGAACGPEGCG